MKQQLSEENVKALVSYRLNRAKETLAEVPNLRDMGYYNTAINRLYYAPQGKIVYIRNREFVVML